MKGFPNNLISEFFIFSASDTPIKLGSFEFPTNKIAAEAAGVLIEMFLGTGVLK